MRFIPSQPGFGTYGDDAPESAEGEKKSGLAQVEAFLPAVRSFLFGESAREEAATLQAQIENLERKLDAGQPGILHNIYVDELNKKRARLVEVQAMSDEEKGAAQKEQITRAAIAAAAVLGTLVVAGMVFNQIQKARLLEAQIHKAEG